MVDEMVTAVALKTGLPKEQAAQAAEAALDYIKSKLPAPLAAQVEQALNSPDAVEQAKGAAGKLSSFLK